MTKSNPVKKAVATIGNVAKTADKMGVFRGSVYYWLKTRCPAEHVLKLERHTGNKVTRYELRPDIYGPKP